MTYFIQSFVVITNYFQHNIKVDIIRNTVQYVANRDEEIEIENKV